MVIKASSAGEIRLLVEALSGADAIGREAAAARLTVIGARAIERLLDAYARAGSASARATILRVLEPMADARALAPARHALQEGGALAVAATQVLRGLLEVSDDSVRSEALDALVAVALDRRAPATLRQEALDALPQLPPEVRARVEADLRGPGPVAVAPAPITLEPPDDAGVAWDGALAGRLPERPASLHDGLVAGAASAPLSALQRLVDALKAREATAGDDLGEWRALRGAVHQALARRGSRVALYDLRESLAAATAPLPVSFLGAVHEVGDASCLEPLAAAHAGASAAEEWWRQQLAAAFRAIVEREKLTKRSAVIKKIEKKWPGMALKDEP